jgi:hypothetical protein
MVRHTGRDTWRDLDRLMPSIEANRWFTCARLVLEEVQNQGLADEDTVNRMAARLEATRVARTSLPPDPCEVRASLKQYMAHLDDAPPKGTLEMNDLRDILEKGLAKVYADRDSGEKHKVVKDVLRSIRLAVGEGPFCGDQAKLIESVERFATRYLIVEKVGEPIDTVLATLLALSFCDISTPEDHDALALQFRKCWAEVQSQVNRMLNERGLTGFVTHQDVEAVFGPYERIIRRYIDDPLWALFKFPLTANEEVKLASGLQLRLMRLEPLLDEIFLKIEHAGPSAELKQRATNEISRVAQSLLPQAAFLRSPPYPGVSGQYRGGYGFSVVIKSPLYQEDRRPREKFRAMKYFHLGHRLQGTVETERGLIGMADGPIHGPEAP